MILLPALALLAACEAVTLDQLRTAPALRCPQTEIVHEATLPVSAWSGHFNIVVLADGFKEADLDVFRCATRLMFERVFATPPFDRFACRTNVYRLDVASSYSTIGLSSDGCADAACTAKRVDWGTRSADCGDGSVPAAPGGVRRTDVAGLSVGPAVAPACVQIDIGSSLCAGLGRGCWTLWPEGDGPDVAVALADCAPAWDVVVVLANSGAGAASASLPDGSPPSVVVTSLDAIADTDDRANRLLHELGHALGLLDEYGPEEVELDDVPFHPGRNVTEATEGFVPDLIPWSHLCADPSGAVTSSCSRAYCDVDGCIHEGEFPVVGLFHGAHYHDCEYYRGTNLCRMRTRSRGFCPVCSWWMEDYATLADVVPCATASDVVLFEMEFDWSAGSAGSILNYSVSSSSTDPPAGPLDFERYELVKFVADVVRDGVAGQVEADRIELLVEQSPLATSHTLAFGRLQAPGGVSFSATVDGQRQPLGRAFELAVLHPSGSAFEKPGPVRVRKALAFDRVEGRSWNATGVTVVLRVPAQK
ncbi:MAG TPA: M64 family metallopeptidase [Candidatus Polarisedimenticolaceae bacterium]